MMNPSTDSIMEVKEEVMIPSLGGNPTSRKAHFLKPIADPSEGLPAHPCSSNPFVPKIRNAPLKVIFKGRKKPQKKWKTWVDQLMPFHQHTCKKAGIFEAILASTYYYLRDNDLVIALAERWCVETKTFIFPWGEATISLEDLMVLGGYSVLGKPIFSTLDSEDLLEMEKNLKLFCKDTKRIRYIAWMDYFMGKADELEHVAFLALWLSRHVFPVKNDFIAKELFPIAIHLSKGIPIALAPAILASIYNELSLLKGLIVSFSKLKDFGFEYNDSKLSLWSPHHLVQLWAWERFPTLRPQPHSIQCGEPRSARWHRLQKLKLEDVRELMDSAAESFLWRPYAGPLKIWEFCKWYVENELYVVVDSEMEVEVEVFVRFLRVSELVGLDCIQQYLPHRVAMQFGFDQDIPGSVVRQNRSPEIAWSNYSRPIGDANLYMPPRLYEADVTSGYFEWWKQQKMRSENVSQIVTVRKPATKNRPQPGQLDDDDHLPISKVFNYDEDKLTIAELMNWRKRLKSIVIMQCSSSLAKATSNAAIRMERAIFSKEHLPSNKMPEKVVEYQSATNRKGHSANLDLSEGKSSKSSIVRSHGLEHENQNLDVAILHQKGCLNDPAELRKQNQSSTESADGTMKDSEKAKLKETLRRLSEEPGGLRLEARLRNVEILCKDLLQRISSAGSK